MIERAGARALGAVLAQHVVLLWTESAIGHVPV
jgi:hypothetical protein